MNIILLKDVEGLGQKYDTVEVKNGYGRNYLIPQKMAVIANKSNRAKYTEILKQINFKENKQIEQIKLLVEQLKEAPIKVGAKVGSSDKIFGSVTNVQLVDAIREQRGIDIDRRKVSITDEVKTIGNYRALVQFRSDMKFEIDFEVVPE